MLHIIFKGTKTYHKAGLVGPPKSVVSEIDVMCGSFPRYFIFEYVLSGNPAVQGTTGYCNEVVF